MFEAPASPYLVSYNGDFDISAASTKPQTDGHRHKGKHRRAARDNLSTLQQVLAAGDRRSVLLVFQAMGMNYLISPALAAWCPLMIFVPCAVVLSESLRG